MAQKDVKDAVAIRNGQRHVARGAKKAAAGGWPPAAVVERPENEVWETALDDDSRAWLEAGSPRLFDLAADSGENRDVAAEHPDVVNDLRNTLDAWWMPGPPQSGANSP
jgi:hypothetical protein